MSVRRPAFHGERRTAGRGGGEATRPRSARQGLSRAPSLRLRQLGALPELTVSEGLAPTPRSA